MRTLICPNCNNEFETHKKSVTYCSKTCQRKFNNRKTSRNYYYQHYENRLEYFIVKRAKKRAEDKGLDFDLEIEDIVIPEFCPVFGIKLSNGSGKGRPEDNSPSIDRIVPELGYVKGNVRIISHLANSMKNSATNEQLLQFASWIFETYEGGSND